MDKILTGVVANIAKQYEVDEKEVEKILVMPYKMMREKIQALELHGFQYDQIQDLKTNFNMPVLFKMHINQYKLNYLNREKDDEEITEDRSGANV